MSIQMLGLLLAPNAYAPPARAVVGVRRAPEVSMLTRRELASSAGAALLAMGTFSGEANAALTAEFRKADQSKIGVSSVASTQQPHPTMDCPRPVSQMLAPDPRSAPELLLPLLQSLPCR